MSDQPEPPKRARFERRVKRDPVELELMQAIRDRKRKGSSKDGQIDEILRRAAEEIKAL